MKKHDQKLTVNGKGRFNVAFTLVELLVVIAIIGVLAALLLPVLNSVIQSAKKKNARLEAQAIAAAIVAYDSAYSRFPVSPAAQAAANTAGGDFTYGAVFGGVPLLNGTYSVNNAEVMAILMDFTAYPGTGAATINAGHQMNSQQTHFLNPKMPGNTTSPGVGTDLVYRDPWGNPYVITMDLSYDELCEDALYKLPAVSGGGLNGLIPQSDGNYAYRGKVMVWSAGPDGKIDNSGAANAIQGFNKDNVLGW